MKNLPEIFEDCKLNYNKKSNQNLAEILYPNHLAGKIMECGSYLRLAEKKNLSTYQIKLFLKKAFFCKDRLCPFCNFIKSRKKARAMLAQKESIKGIYLHIVFTVVDPKITELKKTVERMQYAFHLLKMHNHWRKNVIGSVRALENSRGNMTNNNYLQVHPHYHFLVEVKSSYFRGDNYVSQQKWLEAWRKCYGDENITQVSVQRANKHDELWKNVFEVIKYELKPDCFFLKKGEKKESLQNWLLTYHDQMKGVRQFTTAGTLKKILTLPKNTDKYLDDDEENWILQKYLNYYWDCYQKTYKLSNEEYPQETLKMQEQLFYDDDYLVKKFTSFEAYKTSEKKLYDYHRGIKILTNVNQYYKNGKL